MTVHKPVDVANHNAEPGPAVSPLDARLQPVDLPSADMDIAIRWKRYGIFFANQFFV